MIDPANLPLVSVITPSYNQSRYIRQTIESVLEQDYPNIEHIVVDGASTDDTIEILKEYGEKFPHRFQWISEPDDGQSDAFNKGLKLAGGSIVGWQNSDDYYQPGAISSLVDALSTGNAIVACGVVAGVDKTGHVIDVNYSHINQTHDVHELLFHQNVYNQGALIRRDFLTKVGGLDTKLHYAMDYDLWLRLSLHGTFVLVPQVCAYFRFHDVSKTTSSRPKFYPEAIYVLEKFFSHCSDERLRVKQEAIANIYRLAAVVYAAHNNMEQAHHYANLVPPSYNLDLRVPQKLAGLVLYGVHYNSWTHGSRLAAVNRVLAVLDALTTISDDARRAVMARFYAETACLLQGPGQTAKRLNLTFRSIMLDPSWLKDRRELAVRLLNAQLGNGATRTLISHVHWLRAHRHIRGFF